MLPEFMTNKARKKVRITLQQRYVAGDLFWENTIGLVRDKNIYFQCKAYLPFVECCSTAKQKWNRQVLWRKTHTLDCIAMLSFLCLVEMKAKHVKEWISYFSTIKVEGVQV